MKVIALWLAVFGAAVAVAAGSCSINHRSGDFACQVQGDCASDRTCIDGECVLTGIGGGPPDDAALTTDASTCPPQCTSCDAGTNTCTIDCAKNPDECDQAIACPAGMSCNVMCSTDNACRNGVSCEGATACTISCGGRQACEDIRCGDGACNVTCGGRASCNGVTCGTGACQVDCNGLNACPAVQCGAACSCEVLCMAGAACNDVTCLAGCDLGPGCSSLRNGCNTCP